MAQRAETIANKHKVHKPHQRYILKERCFPLPPPTCRICTLHFRYTLRQLCVNIRQMNVGPHWKWRNGSQPATPFLTSAPRQVPLPGGSTPARIPAVQENVRQGLQDGQNHERACRRKPSCRSARS